MIPKAKSLPKPLALKAVERLRSVLPLAVAVVGVAFLTAGCKHAPDGRKVLLQSEVAVDNVRSFRAHIEILAGRVTMGGKTTTDAEYDCDRLVSHYVVLQEQLDRQIEYIRTRSTIFSRDLQNGPIEWNAARNPAGVEPCQRLQYGQSWDPSDNLFSAERGDILPPFFFFANKRYPANIQQTGKESIEGVDCEIWKVDEGSGYQLHTIWIGVEDRLPRKYVAGEIANPLGAVTFSDYGQRFDFEVPPEVLTR
jgi:hypothetical protein